MKRTIVISVDELRLPAGSRGGLRAQDAIAREIARRLGAPHAAAEANRDSGVGAAVYDGIAPHLPPEHRRR